MDYLTVPEIMMDKGLLEGVRALLEETEAEFVPPLHDREGTTQRNLSEGRSLDGRKGVESYFREMTSQRFVLAVKDGAVAGFLSYRKDEPMEIEGTARRVQYVSTIAVAHSMRCRGIGSMMYHTLICALGDEEPIVTRTWKTNHSHIRILARLGFRVYLEKDEGRTDADGISVSSLYFVKE